MIHCSRCISRFIVVLAWALALAGCGPGNERGRQSIAGQVALDGMPLASGSIQFEPEAAGGVSSGAVIADGSYSIPADQGLPPGKYIVRVFSPEAATPDVALPPGSPGQPGVERVPARYNTASTLVFEMQSGVDRFDVKMISD